MHFHCKKQDYFLPLHGCVVKGNRESLEGGRGGEGLGGVVCKNMLCICEKRTGE